MRLQLTLQPANADFDSVSNRVQTRPCSFSVIPLYLRMFNRVIVLCIRVREKCAHSRCHASYLGCMPCSFWPTRERHVSARSPFCPAFFALCHHPDVPLSSVRQESKKSVPSSLDGVPAVGPKQSQPEMRQLGVNQGDSSRSMDDVHVSESHPFAVHQH